MDPEIRTVLVICAMKEEISPFVEHFGLEKRTEPFMAGSPSWIVAWSGKAGAITLHAVWCGEDERFKSNNVATTAAAVTLYAAVAAIGRPDLVISAGTAGGFAQRGAAIGEVTKRFCRPCTRCISHLL